MFTQGWVGLAVALSIALLLGPARSRAAPPDQRGGAQAPPGKTETASRAAFTSIRELLRKALLIRKKSVEPRREPDNTTPAATPQTSRKTKKDKPAEEASPVEPAPGKRPESGPNEVAVTPPALLPPPLRESPPGTAPTVEPRPERVVTPEPPKTEKTAEKTGNPSNPTALPREQAAAATEKPEQTVLDPLVFDQIRAEIKSRLTYFQACADAARRRGAPDVRRVQATWFIAADGTLKELKLEDVPDPQLALCIVRMGSRGFPMAPGTDVTIPTPIVFVR